MASSTLPYAGQVTVTSTGTSIAALASLTGNAVNCGSVLIQNDASSTEPILVGNGTAQPVTLDVGATAGASGGAVSLDVTSLAAVYLKTPTGTAKANIIAGN